MYNIFEAPFIKEMGEMTWNLWMRGWAERNGGNISQLLDESHVACYLNTKQYLRTIPLSFEAPALASRILLVSGSGKYFKNTKKDPAGNMGIIKISQDGKSYHVLWGLEQDGVPTSELASHLKCHIVRLERDCMHRVVLHTHALAISAMTFVHELDENKLTKTLWQMITECLLVFPDGVALVPWMVAGTNELGEASAEKMKHSRIVIWAHHGIMGAGSSLDDAFGLVETVEKAAEIYMSIAASSLEVKQTITDAQLKELAAAFGVMPKPGILE